MLGRSLIQLCLVTLLGVILAIGIQLYIFLRTPIKLASDTEIIAIEQGSSLRRVTAELKAKGIISNKHFLEWLCVFSGQARDLKAGEYLLNNRMLPSELLELVTLGRVHQYQLTIVEGSTFQEIRENLIAHPKIVNTLLNKPAAAILSELELPYHYLDGLFYPETYNFPSGTTDKEFLQRAFYRLQAYLKSAWESKSVAARPLDSMYSMLTLASIVEKETTLSTEYPKVAAVLLRRLTKSMRLQADPTVYFATGKPYTTRLTKADLNFMSPYNTYRIKGLPPGPIGTVSKLALDAVSSPSSGTELYFVANGRGGHVFSSSLKEHNIAVAKYRKYLETIANQ